MIPINHRLDAPAIYIFASDDAWDHERITAEKSLVEAWAARRALEAANAEAAARGEEPAPLPELERVAWESWRDHPVARYQSGASRFDRATIAGYIKSGAKPTTVTLRHMSLSQWSELQALFESEATGPGGETIGRTRTLIYSLRHGVEEFAELKIKAGARGLTDADLDALRRAIGDANWLALAYACMTLQNVLTPDESFR